MWRNYFFQKKTKSYFNEENSDKSKKDDFDINYDKFFDKLRSATKNNRIIDIETLKNSFTKSQWLILLHDKNTNYSDCAIIHYAAKYNKPEAIQSLVGHLNVEERLKIFQIAYSTGCTTLHFTATVNHDLGCNYEAAAKIKHLLYADDDHSLWLKLLAVQQECLDTAVHYAARLPSAKLLNLLSAGLSSDEWMNVLSIRNDDLNTAVHVYLINMRKKIDGSRKEFITALRGSLTDSEWVNFLISNNVLNELNPNSELERYCFQQMLDGLPSELTAKLAATWQASEQITDNISQNQLRF